MLCCVEFPNVRLVGKTVNRGRLEIYYKNEWGKVCDDYWDNGDATVVCRQLGYVRATGTQGQANDRLLKSIRILMDDVRCRGIETNLQNCSFTDSEKQNCDHDEDVKVACGRSMTLVGKVICLIHRKCLNVTVYNLHMTAKVVSLCIVQTHENM